VSVKELAEKLATKKRDMLKRCDDCVYAETRKTESKEESQVEEQLEFVMICLDCLHVGCTRKKLGHAEDHFKKNPTHTLVRGIVGRLYCYACDQDVDVEEDTKQIISAIQEKFDYVICGPSSQAPASPGTARLVDKRSS
jgi:uncharacterized UBP type Zn finger protein